MLAKPTIKNTVILGIVLAASISLMAWEVPRHNATVLMLCYSVAFFSYFMLSKVTVGERSVIIIGALVRLLLFSTLPFLSDDFYRFLWDGELMNQGINPYSLLPSEAIGTSDYFTEENLALLNSPNYYTVYPPLNQFIFWLSSTLGTSSLGSVNIIRFIILVAELGGLYFFHKLASGKTAWFYLNPLLIIEGVGNLHFESLVIVFLVLGIYFMSQHRHQLSGVALGLAIATKLIPVIFIPAFTWKLRWKKGIVLSSIAGIIALLTFLPLISSALQSGMSNSIKLYFQSFEFNASLYYVFREIGFWQKGYNVIQTLGPKLGIGSAILITAIAIWGDRKKWPLSTIMLLSLTIYLLLSTTVHPWYILPLIPLGLISGFYFPVLWSLLIFTTYSGYTLDGYETPVFWIYVEYALLYATIFYEFWNYTPQDRDLSSAES